MATVCDACGVRENEVKAGSGIEPQGQKITLHIHNIEDLSRDVLKVGCMFFYCKIIVKNIIHLQKGRQTHSY